MGRLGRGDGIVVERWKCLWQRGKLTGRYTLWSTAARDVVGWSTTNERWC
jgi:hypothetical protein